MLSVDAPFVVAVECEQAVMDMTARHPTRAMPPNLASRLKVKNLLYLILGSDLRPLPVQ
jgi:hypothetical protein